MKKILALAAVLSALTLSLAGCTGGASSDNSASSDSSSSSGEPMTSESHESAATGGEDSAPSDILTSETSGDNSSDSSESAERTAAALGEAVKNAVEFPAMEDANADFDVTDIEVVDSFYSVNLMSPQLYRIVIIKPTEETKDAAAKKIEEYAEYMKTEAAFYPDQEISAAGTVSGVTPDGFYYVIVHEDGAKAEEALLSA